jgi:ribosomal silencing factor RsfS
LYFNLCTKTLILEEIAVAIALAEAANEVKGAEIQVLFVKPLIYWARYFVLATAFSKPQVDAIGYAQNLI